LPNSNKIVIDVWSGGRTDDPFIVTDRFGRFRLSAGLVKLLSAKNAEVRLYVGYDKANKRIALGKADLVNPTDSKPVLFDSKRHYGNVRGFMRKHGIPEEAIRYVYDGKYEGWLMFKREDFAATDGRGS
jgi:hypothetical protein